MLYTLSTRALLHCSQGLCSMLDCLSARVCATCLLHRSQSQTGRTSPWRWPRRAGLNEVKSRVYVHKSSACARCNQLMKCSWDKQCIQLHVQPHADDDAGAATAFALASCRCCQRAANLARRLQPTHQTYLEPPATASSPHQKLRHLDHAGAVLQLQMHQETAQLSCGSLSAGSVARQRGLEMSDRAGPPRHQR